MNAPVKSSGVVPFSLKDAPSLIERLFPAQKISVEAQKERKANLGQTLTGLGSYWKGRKPLILARACLIASLLPATSDAEEDLAVFEILCGLSDAQIVGRYKSALTLDEIETYATPVERSALLINSGGLTRLNKLNRQSQIEIMSGIIARMPYITRTEKLLRPEEVSENILTAQHLNRVNRHLGTTAVTISELIKQIGIMRFGRRPQIADTFSGGGSIPFEAARLGCDVRASDLNPIACLLTWGSLSIIGASSEERQRLKLLEQELIQKVDSEITCLGIEHDKHGNRAKAYLYCMEALCPQTGWRVPMAGSWVISKSRNVVAKLVPLMDEKRFEILVVSDVSDQEVAAADLGTVRGKNLVYELNGETISIPIKTVRGDKTGGLTSLRSWSRNDITPKSDDIFTERLYCIHWISASSIKLKRQKTYFAAPTEDDIRREALTQEIVIKNMAQWQSDGLMPNMPIEAGDNTSQPMRERGWTQWHQLFTPRDHIVIASVLKNIQDRGQLVAVPSLLNHSSKLCQWITSAARKDKNGAQLGGPRELPNHVFYNQALNTFWNYASRASNFLMRDMLLSNEVPSFPIDTHFEVIAKKASEVAEISDIYITDPPYADAVNYHEITEFFIAWCRGSGRKMFPDWTWDSRRSLAIKGNGEDFRKAMVDAYSAMARHMPDNGVQIVMFTHQDASVWADMAQIFWGSGLQVMAAWYIATETTSELKKGGYVQGTVILVLRKRAGAENGYKDEVVQEVRIEVAEQIDTMSGLNQNLKGHGRVENLFEDADLQMAGYAAALRVLTRYTKIDGVDMTKEALRPRKKNESGIVADIIDFAVQVANEHMVPEGMGPKLWEHLTGTERFYFKMMDIETTGARKLDNYQNFAKAFRVRDYSALMGSTKPNEARLKQAKDFKKAGFEIEEFGPSSTRAVLFALYEIQTEMDGEVVLSHLKDLVPTYMTAREDIIAMTDYIGRKREGVDESEHRAAGILYGLIRNERLG